MVVLLDIESENSSSDNEPNTVDIQPSSNQISGAFMLKEMIESSTVILIRGMIVSRRFSQILTHQSFKNLYYSVEANSLVLLAVKHVHHLSDAYEYNERQMVFDINDENVHFMEDVTAATEDAFSNFVGICDGKLCYQLSTSDTFIVVCPSNDKSQIINAPKTMGKVGFGRARSRSEFFILGRGCSRAVFLYSTTSECWTHLQDLDVSPLSDSSLRYQGFNVVDMLYFGHRRRLVEFDAENHAVRLLEAPWHSQEVVSVK